MKKYDRAFVSGLFVMFFEFFDQIVLQIIMIEENYKLI